MHLKSFKYFFPEKPKLISKDQPLFQRLNDNPSWIAEFKYNDNRLQLHNLNGKFEFWNRHNQLLSYKPTDKMINGLNKLDLPKGYNLFDGGLRHNKVVGVRNKIILFDVFIWDGEVLLDKTFKERRKILDSVLGYESETIRTTEQFNTHFNILYNNILNDPEIEGLIIKDLNGKLNLSRVSGQDSVWMKKIRKATGRHRI